MDASLRTWLQSSDPNRPDPFGTDAAAREELIKRLELRDLGGPGSGNFGHEGRPGLVGGSGSGGDYSSFERISLENLEGTSRTAGGVSDTSSSADKPKLAAKEGDELASKTRENFKAALQVAWDEQDRSFESPEDVVAFTDKVAATVSKDLLPEGQGLYRTWETTSGAPGGGKQTTPAEIQTELNKVGSSLYERLEAKEDPVTTAAWFEKEMARVHPWADGVGRTTKVLSAFILARGGSALPKYPDRKTYYQKIKSDDWEAYFRSLI